MSILHSHFIGNTGLYGGGLAITIMYLPSNNQPFLSNALVTYMVHVENTTFTDNTAWLGSAVFITQSLFYSFQFLLPQTYLRYLNSHAERFGSAVYYLLPVENYMVRTTTSCFMTMLFLPPNLTLEDSGVSVDFINNTAIQAGGAMYGTPIDREVCTTVTVQYIEHAKLSPLQSSVPH